MIIDFDTSTAAGQLRLAAVSMGLDSETYLPRSLGAIRQSPVAAPAKEPRHALMGARVRATWKALRGHAEVTEGEVIAVSPVSFSNRLRLAVLREDGTTQRCYTDDRDWSIEVLAAA